MSPRLLCGFHASRLSAGAMLLALLVPAAAAQGPPDEPFTSVVDGQSYLGNTPIRLWHRTRGFGEESGETAFGTHWAAPLGENIAFVDGQFRLANDDSDFSMNAGVGFRWRADDFFTGYPRILGVSFWYDGEDTELDNYFNQLGVSFERLGPMLDLRLNVNIPLEDPKQGDDAVRTGNTTYVGHDLAEITFVGTDVPLRVVDFEVAPRIFNFNAWAYGGGYQMDGDGISEMGWKAGGRGYITNDLALDVGVTDDEQFGTNTVVQIIWTPGRTTPTMSSWSHTIDDRMREQVYRNAYVATEQTVTTGAEILHDANGQRFNIEHLNSSAAPGGDGTFARPYNTLAEITSNTEVGDIIFTHAESQFAGQNVQIKDSQRFLGEGGGVVHTVVTQELGTVNLPESRPGASSLAKPVISNAGGAGAIILAGGTVNVNTLARMEVNNFQIQGGTSGIVSPNGVGGVDIDNMTINATTSHGIDLKPLVETLANGNQQQRFQPTITDSVFNGVLGNDINLVSQTPGPGITAVEATSILRTTSTNGSGVGINLVNNRGNATITNYTWTDGGNGVAAIRTTGGATGSNVVGNTVVINPGVLAGVGTAVGIDIQNSASAHTFNDTTITNTGGDSVVVNGGTAGLQFRGSITQGNNQSVVSVTDHATGTLNFAKATTAPDNTAVITATNGDGLQFSNADGTYTFGSTTAGSQSKVVLNGGDAGIDVVAGTDGTNGSQGTFAFNNVDIDFNNTTNDVAAVRVDGSTPVAFTLNGDVDVDGGRPVEFTNNKGGSFTIASTIQGNDEEIFISGNTGGIFAFTGAVDFNTTTSNSRAIEITNNTAGTTRFSDIDIIGGTADAFVVTSSAGHTLEVLAAAGVENTIELNGAGPNGVGLLINQVTIGSGNVNFAEVTVNNAASSGIQISNTTGTGQIIIGSQGAAVGDGGEITAAGAAVSLTDAANVSLNHMRLISTGAQGLDYARTATQSATTRLTLNGNRIEAQVGGAEGVRMVIDGSNQANFTLTGNNISAASATEEALDVDTLGGVKDIRFLVTGSNEMTNNSNSALTADFNSGAAGSFNSSVIGPNLFTNNGTAQAFATRATGAATTVRLNLDANTGVSPNAQDFLLQQTGGTFNVLNEPTVNTRNTGGVQQVGTIGNDPGPIPQPQ